MTHLSTCSCLPTVTTLHLHALATFLIIALGCSTRTDTKRKNCHLQHQSIIRFVWDKLKNKAETEDQIQAQAEGPDIADAAEVNEGDAWIDKLPQDSAEHAVALALKAVEEVEPGARLCLLADHKVSTTLLTLAAQQSTWEVRSLFSRPYWHCTLYYDHTSFR
jgi:hypothetical protein